VTAAITAAFARDGYPRTIGGPASSVDLGVSYLLPPFVPASGPTDASGARETRVEDVWRTSATRMARAAGGLAPGGSWPDDGVSWNTATSSHALTSAFVDDRPEAVRWLRWLDAHRTAAGSLPEKVLADGRPASVAPLAWPAAAVLIAADELGPPA
jgi:glucoamylase